MKYNEIAKLESELREIETAHCWAVRSGENRLAQELYLERGSIIKQLQNIR